MGRATDSNLYNLVGWVLLLPHFMDGKTEAQEENWFRVSGSHCRYSQTCVA